MVIARLLMSLSSTTATTVTTLSFTLFFNFCVEVRRIVVCFDERREKVTSGEEEKDGQRYRASKLKKINDDTQKENEKYVHILYQCYDDKVLQNGYEVSKHSSVSFLGISILQLFDFRMKSTQFWCCIRQKKIHFKMKRSVCGAFSVGCASALLTFALIFYTFRNVYKKKEPFKKWLRYSTSATNNSLCMSCNVSFNFISFNRILLFLSLVSISRHRELSCILHELYCIHKRMPSPCELIYNSNLFTVTKCE